jgi:soluble lytic murein transglycosylase-like protein
VTRAILVTLALAWSAMFYLVPVARASTTTELAISVLCGPSATYLAPHVDAASRRYLVDRVLLVAIMARESGCRPHVIGKHGDIGLMQLRGVARNGLSRRALLDPRTNLMTGARWLALRSRDCAALGVLSIGGYNARECRHGKRYARKVLATVFRAWREMQKRKEPRS